MKAKVFREYDIRGIYPKEINEDFAYKMGLGYGSYLQTNLKQTACVVSCDNRLSSENLHQSLIKGLLESGIDVIDYGLTTTPMHYYARHINNLFGVMITASHNPKEYNGFKFSFDEFANARGEMIQNFKKFLDDGNFTHGNGCLQQKDITEDYTTFILDHLKFGKKKIKVVLDPANGAVTSIAREIYEKLNIDLVIINEESDGSFPNHQPDPSIEANLKQLKYKVLEVKADIGIGFDGDGDRIGIVDELGNLVSIESYAVIILRNIIDKVENKKFLYDPKCSDIFKDEIERLGGTPIICRTGSSYTQEKILKDNIPFGIQYVGHIGLNDRLFCTESAIYSSLRLIEVLSKTKKSLSELVSTVGKNLKSKEVSLDKDSTKKEIIKAQEKNENYIQELPKAKKGSLLKRIFIYLILLICLLVLIFSAYKIYSWIIDHNYNKDLINTINETTEITQYDSEDALIVGSQDEKDSLYWSFINTNLLDVDFSELKKTNNDTVAWIYVEGTNVNYPVVQTNDNSYYLNHSFDKSTNSAGWLFMDYRNNINTYNNNTIIYAHNRKDQTMFGSLKTVLNKSWYNNSNNQVIKMSTEQNNTLWQIFSIYTIETTNDYIKTTFSSTSDYQNFIDLIQNRSIYDFGVSMTTDDKILTLSTCHGSTKKLVVHAKLIKIDYK